MIRKETTIHTEIKLEQKSMPRDYLGSSINIK